MVPPAGLALHNGLYVTLASKQQEYKDFFRIDISYGTVRYAYGSLLRW